ncbi:unnamed protein product [Allacma fusca]|uniref:Uncharacterized protein n=1 Tax=Allacma fusca TaxID=39272 RepID=A0A8J2L9I9_9HEXA|nr:unnamed protein product [Allacma fusca]
MQTWGGRQKSRELRNMDDLELIPDGYALFRHKNKTIHVVLDVSRYANISAENLDAMVANILQDFPNSGYRHVQGYLQARDYTVQQCKIRESVKRVDPRGVFQRTISYRIIVRRKYFVRHSNDIWHIDTHLKLVR